MEQKIITVIGGTGFLGRYVVQALARAGYRLRVVSRHPERLDELKTLGEIGQIAIIDGNLNDISSIIPSLEGAYGVIDMVGILFENGNQRFSNLHSIGAEKLAIASKQAGVQRFIYISALGVENEFASAYARSKFVGERAVLAAFPSATILRPSIMFGAEDNFFNKFAKMAILAPFIPLIGGGKTLFQPIYVGDVAKAIVVCLEKLDPINPENLANNISGEIYELGGRKTYSFKEILQYIMKIIGKKKPLIPIPFWMASIIGRFMELLPNPPITRDQVKLLEFDNTVNPHARNLAHLGISPAAMEDVVPKYLEKFSKNRYQKEIGVADA